MPSLSSLLVDLQVNTAALRSGLDQAQGLLKNFGHAVSEIGEKLRGLSEMQGFEVGKEAIEGLTEFVLKGNEAVVQMGRMAAASGVPIDEFSKLNYVAALNGISTEELSKSFNHLNKSLADAAAGVKTPTALYRALGVSVTDAAGNVKSGEAVFLELGEKFAGMGESAAKSRLEMEVFGKSGTQLDQMLSELREGLGEAGKEAERFGLVITPAAAAAAKQFEDATVKLHLAFQAVAQRVAAELAPALTGLTNDLLNSKDGSSALSGTVDVLATTLRVLASAVIVVAGTFRELGANIGAVFSAIASAAQGEFGEAAEAVRLLGDDILKIEKQTHDQLDAVWKKSNSGALDFNANLQPIKTSAQAVLNTFHALDALPTAVEGMKALTKVLDEYGKKVAELRDAGDPLAEITYRLDKGDLAKDLAAVGQAATEMRQKVLDAAMALHELQLGKLSIKVDFDIIRAAVGTSFDIGQRQKSFGQVGLSQPEVTKQNEGGFSSFEKALEELARQTDMYNRKLGEAQLLKLDGDDAAANRALLAADQNKRAADLASKAADAWQKEVEQLNEETQRAISSVGNSLMGFTTKLGQLGDVISAGISGFQSGGIWGAIAAVLVSILEKFKGFQTLVDLGTGQLNQFLGQLTGPLTQLMGALKQFMVFSGVLTQIIGQLLGPVFTSIGHALRDLFQFLTPILSLVRTVISPIVEIVNVFLGLIDSLDVLKPVITVVSTIFNFIAVTFLWTTSKLQEVFFNILQVVIDFLHAIGADATGVENLAASVNQAMSDNAVKAANIWNHITDPNANADQAAAGATDNINGMGDSAGKAATSIQKMTAQLTNAPAGFKIALDRFNATTATGGPAGLAPRSSPVHIDKLVVQASNMLELYAQLKQLHDRSVFQHGGG